MPTATPVNRPTNQVPNRLRRQAKAVLLKQKKLRRKALPVPLQQRKARQTVARLPHKRIESGYYENSAVSGGFDQVMMSMASP